MEAVPRLRVSGWGPVALPGEKRRLARAALRAEALLRDAAGDDSAANGDVDSESGPVGDGGPEDAPRLASGVGVLDAPVMSAAAVSSLDHGAYVRLRESVQARLRAVQPDWNGPTSVDLRHEPAWLYVVALTEEQRRHLAEAGPVGWEDSFAAFLAATARVREGRPDPDPM